MQHFKFVNWRIRFLMSQTGYRLFIPRNLLYYSTLSFIRSQLKLVSVDSLLYSSCRACKSALVQLPMFSSFYFRVPSILSPPFFLFFLLSILHFLRQFLNVFTNSLFGGLVLLIVVPCVLWLALSLIGGFKSSMNLS